jgi:hypothetical protein
MTALQSPTPGSFNNWLATLPEATFETFVGCVVAAVVVGFVLYEAHHGRDIGPNATWIVTTVIGALLGVGHLSYRVKRQTWRPDGDTTDDPDTPTIAPPTTPERPPYIPQHQDGLSG